MAPRDAAPKLLLVLALAAAAVAYGPAIHGEFHFDDHAAIVENGALRDPGRLLGGLSPAQLVGPGRPVTQVSLALDYALGRLDPAQYHRTSLALHLLTAVLVFVLARGAAFRAGSANPGALAAVVAAAFALHPVQSEAVAYAAQRSEVLASALALGALLMLLASTSGDGAGDGARTIRRAWALVVAATLLHLFAIGAKPVAVWTPAAFVLHRLVLPGPAAPPLAGRLRRALARSAPLWIVSAVAAARLLVVLGPGSTAGLHAGELGPWRYLLTQLRAHWLYARLVAWPAGQTVDHALVPSPGLMDMPTALSALATVAVLVAAAMAWRRAERRGDGEGRLAVFGVGFFLIALAPSSSAIPIQDPFAEHRVYLASAGLLLAGLALGDALLRRLAPRHARWAGAAAVAALLLVLGGALHARAEVWASDLALWGEAVRANPTSVRAWVNLGRAHDQRRELAQAFDAYRRGDALARGPAEVALACANLGAWYGEAGQPERALATVERGLAVAPLDPPLQLNRAAALWKLGRLAEAEGAARNASYLRAGGYPEAQRLLGLVLWDLGDRDGALRAFAEARRLAPDVPVFLEQEFVALARTGRVDEACRAWSAIARARWTAAVDAGTRQLSRSLGCR